ncbi:MAG: RDD family protein [Thermoplasmata archaeon]|nr:MAG: RDD family protein [Thermoplasmata archaeon]
MVSAINIIGSNSQLQDHWVRRILALIIDIIILVILTIIIMIFLGMIAFVVPGGIFVLAFIPGIIWFAYIFILEGISGATLGKRFMNFRVVSTTGEMGIFKSIIRNITKIHILILLIDWLIGLVMEGDPRQRLFDRFANTTVVRTDTQEIIPGAYQPPSGPMPSPIQPPRPTPQASAPQQTSYAPSTGAYPPTQTPSPHSVGPAPTKPQQEEVYPVSDEAPKKYTRDELVNLRKDDLMKMARDRGLKTSGTKRDLIDRLLGEEV